MARAPVAKAQAADSETKDGTISGTVLLKASNRPASQVAVKLKSHVAGIFRSVLTDLEATLKYEASHQARRDHGR